MGKDLLVDGAVIHLWSKQSGKCLRISDDAKVTATGRNGEFAKFHVHAGFDGDFRFQNYHDNSHYLAIRDGKVKTDGIGGRCAQFYVVDHGPGFVSLESKEHRGKYVGSNGDGDLEIRSQTSDHTKFYVIPVEPGGSETIPSSGRHLYDGAEVRLWSCAYGMNVRIQQDGSVDGKGWSAKYALYTVHKENKHVVRLQNVQNPDQWIAIRDGQTTGIATGGRFTHLRIHDAENGMVCLEAVENPGQHLGVLPNGDLKAPGDTGKGFHGQFHILLC